MAGDLEDLVSHSICIEVEGFRIGLVGSETLVGHPEGFSILFGFDKDFDTFSAIKFLKGDFTGEAFDVMWVHSVGGD